ncbi:MAG: HAD-IA family hydrolase [Saprospiraceae bacterium]
MILTINNRTTIVFDLDDTLYNEVDFLKSAYRLIAKKLEPELKKNIYREMLGLYKSRKSTFDVIFEKYNPSISIDDMISLYRYHKPILKPADGVKNLLAKIKKQGGRLGLLTDGRSISQRNKLDALKLKVKFDLIVISEEFGSEKPAMRNYKIFEEKLKAETYIYIGDNIKKDFVSPNKLGWETICLLDNGYNIHYQDWNLNLEYLPKYKITSFNNLLNCIN